MGIKTHIAIVMTALVLPGFALDRLDTIATGLWARPLPAAKDSVAMVLTQEGPGRFRKSTARTSYSANPDGSVTCDYSGPDESSRAVFFGNGSLLSSRADNVKDGKTYNVRISPDRSQAAFRTEVKGKEPAAKTFAIKANTVVMPEYQNLVRQAWSHGLRGGFAFKGLAPDGSLEIDMETRLVETETPWKLGATYDFPAEFKAAFPASRKYLVADFCLGGMFSILYKFHNYWIFEIGASGLEYAGSFGGDPKKATFIFRDE
jgi:hypothetical protein